MKTIVVTGTSTGIGYEICTQAAKLRYNVISISRNIEPLSKVNGIESHSVDITDKKSVSDFVEDLSKRNIKIDILINNAGNAHGLDTIQEGSLDDWDNMIDSNIKGLLYVSRAIIPEMVEKKNGHIINIGSLAGREVYEKGNVYCASKHAVNAISKAMRIDLNKSGIKVSEINPGLVETDFSNVRFKGDNNRAEKVYVGYKALQADDIADIIEFVINRPSHVNIADILVLPKAQATSSIINKN
mgnify:CR=1 FL=1